jgi:hypothetical protein
MSLLVHADCCGFPDKGLRQALEFLAWAREGAQLLLLAFALNCVATILAWRREGAEALKYSDALLALTVEHGFSNWQSFGQLVHGQSLALLGKADEAVAEIKSTLELSRRVEARFPDGRMRAWHSRTLRGRAASRGAEAAKGQEVAEHHQTGTPSLTR